MKSEIYSIEHIIEYIKKIKLPVTKDMHKLINNILILLDKNVIKKDSPQEVILIEKSEFLNEMFLELCFLRKELVLKFSEEYSINLESAIKKLQENKNLTKYKEKYDNKLIEWNLKTECENTYELISYIFNKLGKAKMVIEENLQNKCKYDKSSIEADAYFEAYLSNL